MSFKMWLDKINKIICLFVSDFRCYATKDPLSNMCPICALKMPESILLKTKCLINLDQSELRFLVMMSRTKMDGKGVKTLVENDFEID